MTDNNLGFIFRAQWATGRTMKKDFGRKILGLMAKVGIKTAKELADRINTEAGEVIVTPASVGKWLAGKTQPKATSLMFLAKALKVSADVILYDEDENVENRRPLEQVVGEMVVKETHKLFKEGKIELQEELALVLKSDKIPQEDKDALIRQARNLLKLYEETE